MSRRPDVAAAIVAGGRARRFGGRVKPLVEVGGRSILEAQLGVLRPLFDEILIAANDPAPYAHTGLPVVADSFPGAGPLAGIHAARRASERPWLLAVAGDMPYLSADAIECLLEQADGVDAVAPRVNGFPQALHALYGPACAAAIERRLSAGRARARDLLDDPGLRVIFVDDDRLLRVDPELRFLRDVDSPGDLP